MRHGHLPEREVMTGIGPVAVRQPRVRDREAAADDPGRVRFSPSILPPYMRRSKSIETLLPILYLKGISTGDFSEALSALLGKDAELERRNDRGVLRFVPPWPILGRPQPRFVFSPQRDGRRRVLGFERAQRSARGFGPRDADFPFDESIVAEADPLDEPGQGQSLQHQGGEHKGGEHKGGQQQGGGQKPGQQTQNPGQHRGGQHDEHR